MDPNVPCPGPDDHPTTVRGSCPNCGDPVPRVTLSTADVSVETYDCAACGRFQYGTTGLQVPLVVPVPGWAQ